jgi:hypothetical protein
MSRKIVSQTNDYTISFPSLGFPITKELEEDTEINGVIVAAGDRDPRYPSDADLESIPLVAIGNRIYHSVHGDYTEEMLEPTEDNDYVIEENLDGNFTLTVLNHNTGIANKYKKNSDILDILGLPEYDEEVHKTDLFLQSTVLQESYLAAQKFEEDRLKKLEEDAKMEEKPSEEEIEALAASLAGISSGTVSPDAVNNV